MEQISPALVRFSKIALIQAMLVSGGVRAEEPKPEAPGAKIYREMCVDCHGKKGEGVAGKRDEPLIGHRSLAGLTKYISRTMPEDKEGTCVGEDAKNVAEYIYEAFYSPSAQARNNPVHESLSRLTVAQYQNSVADLIGVFRGTGRPGAERGLKGHYSGFLVPPPEPPPEPAPVPATPAVPEGQAVAKVEVPKEPPKKKEKVRHKFDRVDGQVAFHFGAESPDAEKLISSEFNIRWDGGIIAPETGLYEFILKTENGARLYVNNPRDPIIDGWVSSGPNVREEKRTIFLLGGRTYPLSVEFFKFKDKSASVELHWKPPHGRQELIPKEQLTPQGTPECLVVTSSFPADDRSDGYERGTTISKEWDQATTAAALEVLAYVEATMDGLAQTKPGAPDRPEKLKNFASKFVQAAFRRPLNEEQKQRYIERQFEGAPSPDAGVKRAVLLALKSPLFLYPQIAQSAEPDQFSTASRLALVLWDSIPDAPLAKAAAEGRLSTREQLAKEVTRMIPDPRTKAKLHGFYHHWLELERAEFAAKDMKEFPGFDDRMLADLRESLFRFLDEVVWSPSSDYRQLLQADYLWLNERLAKFYGKQVSGVDFQKVAFDPKERTGLITHPYLLTSLAYSRTTSPIHRGVFLSRHIVGVTLKNPSVAVAFEDAKFDPTLTMREKVSQLTKNASCMGCHSQINPLGFTLEHFDAVGRWRNQDNHKPVNAVGEFETEDGRVVQLGGPKDVASYAVGSESAHKAFVRQLFNHTVKQPVGAFGDQTLEVLRTRFAAKGFNIQALLAEIALTAVGQGESTPKITQTAP